MSARQWVVEADTPHGPVEMTCEAAAHVTRAEVVERLVSEHANDTGLKVADISVTDTWSVGVA